MKKVTFFTITFSLIGMIAIAQKKKDLLLKIEMLKSELNEMQENLAVSQRNEKVNEAKLLTLKEQNSQLKETNASFLKNITLLTEASKKKSENVSNTLQSLKEKENQIKYIGEALAQRDSLKLITLTQLKKELINSSISVKLNNETITLSIPNTLLFENTDKNFEVNENGKKALEQLSKLMNNNPEIKITVQGNSNAIKFEDKTSIDNWDLSSRQAASVVRVLQNQYSIDPKRMNAMGKSEYATTGVDTVTRIIIDPNYSAFYTLVSEYMKNKF
ncbi:OmpA/MotB family protein [Winogradskyella immobilis]|uniref:OmpA family protein n=1 Tax=Winogradskyella immobilis TaxID=2816852 RepID=A0ABS8EMM3_9FLAO|nr:OmpA family protein [Winogradskyella immobilis]MCC1484459.1 OmpA family protein [Winogradskyella immobilis]MCG0016551.1 OmpA family protein [Winogradskyella immobilis]